jgi:glycerol-3-phosphate acyltransferase PlsX
MGGDKAPAEIVAGALQAKEELGVDIILVGRPDELKSLDTGDLDVLPASEVIEMAEDPAKGVRNKKDSSLVRAAEAVRDGKASAMVSAGNTGATMASALLRMGRIKGVVRPAIATPIPVPGAGPTVLLDAGANSECTPQMLSQFARMGAAFHAARYPAPDKPRVGLLSIGEEPGKGDPLRKDTWALLEAEGVGAGQWIGNVEGRDIMTGSVDVVVTDGFTGNVALKTLEGALRSIATAVMDILLGDEHARQASAPLLPSFIDLANTLDPDSTGGAMLLGVNGVCIISHGSSSARAVVNAVRVGAELAAADLVGSMAAAVTP